MVAINDLSINTEGNSLTINASVLLGEAYDNIYLDKIVICTEETYKDTLNPTAELGSEYYVYNIQEDLKNIDITLPSTLVPQVSSFTNHLLFVYVVARGTLTKEVECGKDIPYALGVTMHEGKLYNNFMQMIKDIVNNNCTIPQDFINYFLLYKALETSLECGHNIDAIKYYNLLFNNNLHTVHLNCGCCG